MNEEHGNAFSQEEPDLNWMLRSMLCVAGHRWKSLNIRRRFFVHILNSINHFAGVDALPGGRCRFADAAYEHELVEPPGRDPPFPSLSYDDLVCFITWPSARSWWNRAHNLPYLRYYPTRSL